MWRTEGRETKPYERERTRERGGQGQQAHMGVEDTQRERLLRQRKSSRTDGAQAAKKK